MNIQKLFWTSILHNVFAKFITTIIINSTEKIPLNHNITTLSIAIQPESTDKIIKILNKTTYMLTKILSDLFSIDYITLTNNPKRFQINYHVCSYLKNKIQFDRAFLNTLIQCDRLLLKTQILQKVNSIALLYESAKWLERETWDMFGIVFTSNPDLRRLLNDYGFDGFPLRKDYPLSGYTQLRYDLETSLITIEPVKLTQEFRTFNFLNPWNCKP